MFRSVFSIPPLPAKLFPASTTGYSNGLFISKNQFFENFYFFCFLSFSIIRRTKRRRRRMKQGEGWKALEEIFLDSVTFSSGKTSNFRGETAKLPRVAFSRIFLAPISLEKISKRGGGRVAFDSKSYSRDLFSRIREFRTCFLPCLFSRKVDSLPAKRAPDRRD